MSLDGAPLVAIAIAVLSAAGAPLFSRGGAVHTPSRKAAAAALPCTEGCMQRALPVMVCRFVPSS